MSTDPGAVVIEPGTLVAKHYRIGDILGKGAFGTVFDGTSHLNHFGLFAAKVDHFG